MSAERRMLLRHVVAVAVFGLLVAGAGWLHSGIHPVHRWNRALADTAAITLTLILIIGPAARFTKRLAFLRPYRRELGVAFFVATALHILIYLDGAHDWNVIAFFVARGEEGLARTAAGAANWVGLLALAYGTVLTLTSNDLSQRVLGKGWKFLQQQAYTLFVLVALHGAGYLYLVYKEEARFAPWFWAAVGAVVVLQGAGYFRTLRLANRRRTVSADG